MARETQIKKGRPVQEKPELNIIEKEIEDLIDKEKTKRRIVTKLLNQTDLKNRNSCC